MDLQGSGVSHSYIFHRTNPRRTEPQQDQAAVSQGDGRFSLAQVEELIERRMRRIDPNVVPTTASRASHPFTERLFSVVISEHITLHQLAQLSAYKGDTDPSRHVNQFMSAVLG